MLEPNQKDQVVDNKDKKSAYFFLSLELDKSFVNYRLLHATTGLIMKEMRSNNIQYGFQNLDNSKFFYLFKTEDPNRKRTSQLRHLSRDLFVPAIVYDCGGLTKRQFRYKLLEYKNNPDFFGIEISTESNYQAEFSDPPKKRMGWTKKFSKITKRLKDKRYVDKIDHWIDLDTTNTYLNTAKKDGYEQYDYEIAYDYESAIGREEKKLVNALLAHEAALIQFYYQLEEVEMEIQEVLDNCKALKESAIEGLVVGEENQDHPRRLKKKASALWAVASVQYKTLKAARKLGGYTLGFLMDHLFKVIHLEEIKKFGLMPNVKKETNGLKNYHDEALEN